MTSPLWLFIIFVFSIIFIIFSTARVKLHPFIVLILAAYFVGILSGLPLTQVVSAISEGFGKTIGYIGIVIAAGTVIGTFLEKSGGALSMADTLLRIVGRAKSPLAMSIAGYIISIPVFCDSGFVILSSLNKALSKETKISLSVFAIALSLGLYATHTMVPPTPGPIAASGLLSADLGTVILLGLVASIPATMAGYIFAIKYASRFEIEPGVAESYEELKKKHKKLPSTTMAFLPIFIPIILIVLKSVADFPAHPFGIGVFKNIVNFFGHPITALLIGVFISFGMAPNLKASIIGTEGWVGVGLVNASVIILITGAGGAFGTVLKATPITEYLKQYLVHYRLSIFLPFLIAAALKTAQGSSTVAIITTSSIIAPIMGALGLASPVGRALAVIAIGAGSMVVSHANDSYYWVVSQFSNMDVSTAYKTQSLGTLIEGIAAFIAVAIMALILL